MPELSQCVTTGTGQRYDPETETLIPTNGGGFDGPIAFDTFNQTVTGDTSQTLCSRGDSPGGNAHLVPAIAFGWQNSSAQGASASASASEKYAPALDKSKTPAVAVSLRGRDGGATAELGGDVGNALRASGGGGDKAHVFAAMQVRRLTPIECARLQGFPDEYLSITYRNKPAADGPKYKALGNSWATPVVRWIGKRIEAVEAINRALAEAA